MGEQVVSAVFKFEKATKNTYRFEEKAEGQPPKIGTLYVQKWVFSGGAPQEIAVTVSTVS